MLEVIVPAFNAEAFVVAAVRSLLACPEVDRITVVDDASGDGTVAQLLPLVQQEAPRLRVAVLEENGGQYRAMNAGLGLLSRHADFVAFQDADDLSLPDRFTRTLHELEAFHIVSGSMQQIDAGGAALPGTTGFGYPADPVPSLLRAYGVQMVMGVTTCRREVFEQLGGFEPVWGGGDTQFFCRAAFAGLRMRYLTEALGIQRMHGGQCTARQSNDPVRAAYKRRNAAAHLWWKQMKDAGRLRDWHLRVEPGTVPVKEVFGD